MLSQFISSLIDFLVSTIGSWGYFGIFILMAIESSIIPLPSEIILPPAGILIAQGHFSFILVLLFAILGSLAGALVNYFLAFYLGKVLSEKLVVKYGSFLLITPASLRKAEDYFKNHGSISTFVGRLIPGVRHLISLPAGFSKMPLGKFCLYTSLGAGLWSLILIYLGYIFGTNMALIKQNITLLTLLILGICLVLILIYIVYHKRNKKY